MPTTLRATDSVLRRLLQDAGLRRQFEFFAQPPMKKVTFTTHCCGRGKKLQTGQRINYHAIREHIVKLPADKQQLIKKALGTKELIIELRSGVYRL